jgi:hypothetical protein
MRFLTVAEVRRLAVAIGPAYRALILLGAYGACALGRWPGCAASAWTWPPGWSRSPRWSPRCTATCTWGRPRQRPVGVGLACPEWWSRHCRNILSAGRWSRMASCSPSPTVDRCAPPASARECGGRRRGPLAWRGCASMIAAYGGALWIAAGAGPKEVATRAGHTSVSFTLRPAMPSRPRRGPGAKRAPPASRPRCSDLLGWVAGLPGLEPGTSS